MVRKIQVSQSQARWEKRHPQKQTNGNSISQPQKNGYNIATMNSQQSALKLPNLEVTPITNSQPANMTTKGTQPMTTSTNSHKTQTSPTNQPTTPPTELPKPNLEQPIDGLDPSEHDTPPAAPAPKRKHTAKKDAPVSLETGGLNNRQSALAGKLASFYATIGLFVTRANVYDGAILMQQSQARATELVLVASHHPRMMKTLERLVESNDYVTLALGHGMMVYAILANHGRVKADPQILAQFGYHPAQVLGTVPLPDNGIEHDNSGNANKQYATS